MADAPTPKRNAAGRDPLEERKGKAQVVKPRCPNCGGTTIREYDRVDVGHQVDVIRIYDELRDEDKIDVHLDRDVLPKIDWESAVFDVLWCADCDFDADKIVAFIPDTEEWKLYRERSEIPDDERQDKDDV